jgi:hypothetical protein
MNSLYVNANKSEQLLAVLALTQTLFIKFLSVSSRICCGTFVVLVDSHHARRRPGPEGKNH